MKKYLSALAALALLFACTPEQNNPSGTDEPGGGKDKTVHVTGISLNPTSVTIKEGESVTITATVTPDNAENKAYTWSSSNVQVASVSGGKVTGVKAGSATITATTEDGGKTATCAVTVQQNHAPSVTIGAEHVSAVSVVLQGKANLGSSVAADLKIGFQYSKSAGIMPSNSTTIDAEDADANYNYTTTVTGLDPDTKYYFRSFVRQNGQDTYGETKEFTTKDVASLIETRDASGVEAAKATLNAKLDLTDVQYKTLAYGFLWGTSESALNTDVKCTEIKDNAISTPLTKLSHKTQYWYKAYVTLDSQTFYGEVKTFTTDVVPVESVSLDKTEYTFNTIGNTLTLTATVLPTDATDKSVSWSSDKEAVATVDANGRVNAKGNGNATITVTTKDQGKTATCVITVSQRVTSISLDKTSVTLNEGQEQTLTPTVTPSNAVDKSLNWTSSNASVATVDAEGKVTAVSKGTATIKAETKDGSGKYANCSVTVYRPVSSIELNKTSLVLYRGASNVSEKLTATVNPSDASNTAVAWTSSNTSVATVTNSGVVTGKSQGTATITVTADDGNGAQATCEVEVIQYVTSISLYERIIVNGGEGRSSLPSLLLLEEEHVETLFATVNPSNASDRSITWSSTDDSIASVDNTGRVTAKSKGKATITVTANDGSGVFASCSVEVYRIEIPQAIDMGTNVKWASFNIGASTPSENGVYFAWGETETKLSYQWETYKFGFSQDGPFSKYNIIPYTIIKLDPEDDVAHVKLGGSWRMPTIDDWNQLLKKCTWTWNGANGYIVTAANGNSIFLPAAGYRNQLSFVREGTYGYYWSSTLNPFDGPGYAWDIDFNSKTIGINIQTPNLGQQLYKGFSVRPVFNE